MKKLHREPTINNKYNLDSRVIKKLLIIDREKLKDFGFWYNQVICGWCYSDEVGDNTCCSDNSFWLCIYDKELKNLHGKKKEIKKQLEKANTVDFSFGVYGSHFNKEISKFYNPKDNERFEKKMSRMIEYLDKYIKG